MWCKVKVKTLLLFSLPEFAYFFRGHVRMTWLSGSICVYMIAVVNCFSFMYI